jgi:hypothetical protein
MRVMYTEWLKAIEYWKRTGITEAVTANIVTKYNHYK